MSIQVKNIFNATGGAPGKEDFLTLLESEGVKVQRIISHAASSPENLWYDQAHTEWVLVLRGWALLEFEEDQRMNLNEGDYLIIPPHARHRVSQTGPETVWLVVHLTAGT